jgi:hypothetical protein
VGEIRELERGEDAERGRVRKLEEGWEVGVEVTLSRREGSRPRGLSNKFQATERQTTHHRRQMPKYRTMGWKVPLEARDCREGLIDASVEGGGEVGGEVGSDSAK